MRRRPLRVETADPPDAEVEELFRNAWSASRDEADRDLAHPMDWQGVKRARGLHPPTTPQIITMHLAFPPGAERCPSSIREHRQRVLARMFSDEAVALARAYDMSREGFWVMV